MANIDNLEIVVTANADQAARALDRLTASASRVKGAASQAAGGMRDAADGARDMADAEGKAGDEAQKAEKPIRRSGQAAQDAGKNAVKGAGGLEKFWQALKRIAFYRIVRSVLRSIAEAFKEGISNLYQWSSAVNGRFAKSMDKIATSTLYLKNSLGAMLAPLINTLAPVIEWVIDRIVDVINWINKLFAALSGSQTYTVAKKVATKWDDAAKSVSGNAKQAAEDIKRTLLGFDEINRLEKPNSGSSGGGGGSGNSGKDYTDMFEERKLDGWMSKLAAFIDRFKLQIPAIFTALLAGWAAVKLAVKGVATLTKNWLSSLAGKSIQIAVSLVRKGWETLKGWATSFGAAIVDMWVRIKTTAAELWAKLQLQWAALHPVLKVGIVASVTAAALWAAYQLAWKLSPEKVLQVRMAIQTTAQQLAEQFKAKWALAGGMVLLASVKISETAKEVWEAFKTGWRSVKDRVLHFSVSLAQTADGIWASFKREWGLAANRVVNIGVAISTTASALWKSLQDAWSEGTQKVLGVGAVITTSAAALWKSLKDDWFTVQNKALSVGVSIVTTATSLWRSIEVMWASLANKVLGVGAAITTAAQTLWNSVKRAWDTVTNKVLGVGVVITTVISKLWADFKRAWETSGVKRLSVGLEIATTPAQMESEIQEMWTKSKNFALKVAVAISTTAKSLWDALKRSWKTATRDPLPAKTEISTPTSTLWDWLKSNWKKVAVGALGVGVAIATPWGTLANSLSSLWGNVVSSEGALAFGVTPTLDPVYEGYKNSKNIQKSIGTSVAIQKFVDDFNKKVKQAGPKVNAEVDASPGTGMEWAGRNSGYMKPIVGGATASVGVAQGWKGWVLDKLGLSNLETSVKVGVTAKKGSGVELVQSKGAGGKAWVLQTKALGGILSNGLWSKLPQYAGGTLRAGSVFAAGESGPELVGHVNGRTEVLNKSQLAAAMYSAVNAAMAPAASNFAAAAYSMANGAQDTEDMGEMLGVLREQNDLLRIISEKEFSSEVTAGDISRAMNRYNRRTGTTVVPVG